MMSEFYDHYHRWEPLAEFHFTCGDENAEYDENYTYCLCSRAFIRDGVNTYYVDKEYGSESDIDVRRNSQSQECDEHSHVHFSLDTSYKVKCEKDEGASCYCSASHTDNYCSTDEHDPAQVHAEPSHALQPSDSGADLTYQDCHSDYIEKMDHDYHQHTPDTDENYLAEESWDKFWAINSERLIWASWIKKYSEYINPAYLSENNDLLMDENNIPKPHSAEAIYNVPTDASPKVDEGRERKFSYDSKVNPYKKINPGVKRNEKAIEISDNKDDTWVPVSRRRSCSEHERILSPKTLAGTDSMTNVTKITLSSYDITSSHVTSESSPTDDYSVSSTTSEDPTNDQTRIANIDESIDLVPTEEVDSEMYWQFLWKKHFGEQYALHYASYLECHETKNKQVNDTYIESAIDKRLDERLLDIECENSEGNSQEISSVIEVQTKVEDINLNEAKKLDLAIEDDKNTEVDVIDTLEDEVAKPDTPIIEDKPKRSRRRGKSRAKSARVIGSVGLLLQTLLKEQKEENDSTEVMENGDNNGSNNAGNTENTDLKSVDNVDGATQNTNSSSHQSVPQSNMSGYSYDDGEDDPSEEKPRTLKRSHEIDDEDLERDDTEIIKSTFEIMGFRLDMEKMPKGDLLYRKRCHRLRPPRYKKFAPKKTYFDDDGNPLSDYQCNESEEDKAMRTEDDEAADNQSNNDTTETDTHNINDTAGTVDMKETGYDSEVNKGVDMKDCSERVGVQSFKVPLPPDIESSSDAQENKEESCDGSNKNTEIKRRRRQKRQSRHESERIADGDVPEEIRTDPKMMKYWKKRHSLFHRFDEGIKLDLESWFSVTPENVAWHIANKCLYDVVLDGFCGAGGNTIQFARTSGKVIAIDIDPAKIALARHNASVYGVEDRIQFMVGDFFELAPTLKADMVFLSPPWGGPKYSSNKVYDIETMLEPKPASELMKAAQQVSSNVALYLPRNTRSDQILAIAQEVGGSVEIEQSYLDKRFVAITAYFY